MVRFGVEIEMLQCVRSLLRAPRGWNVVGDGSIRHYKNINSVFGFSDGRDSECGAEMVSPPLELTGKSLEEVSQALWICREHGEVPHANTSIHIHVGMERPMPRVVKAFDWLKVFEQELFNISTGGKEIPPRGIYNDFIYYRPLVSPQYSYDGNGYYRPALGQISDCKTKSELAYAVGRWDTKRNKWYPGRYCAINYAAILEHSTLEFRMWNFTTNHRLVKAWIFAAVGTMQSIVEKDYVDTVQEVIVKGAKEFNASKQELKSCLQEVDKVYYNVYDTIDLSPVKTHMNYTTSWAYIGLDPKDKVERVREVNNAHPTNILTKEDEYFPVYHGGLNV